MSVHTSLKILLILLIFTSAFAQVSSNLQVLKQTYAELFEAILSDVNKLDSSVVILADSDLQHQIAEEQLITVLQKRGVQEISEANAPIDSVAYIKVDLIDQSIAYQKEEKQNLKRTSRVELFIKIVSKDREILLSKTAVHELENTIQKSDIKRVENPELKFTVGEQSRAMWSKLVEPIAVTVVSGTIIYLFYSFRSR